MTVEIPQRFINMKLKIQNGLPVPFTALKLKDGTYSFFLSDKDMVRHCLKGDLCSLCGQKLLRGRWFVGDAAMAFHPNGLYSDLPMHEECMKYALQVCPYLCLPNAAFEAQAKAKRGDGGKTLYEAADPKDNTTIDHDQLGKRPEIFVCVRTSGNTVAMRDGKPIKLFKPTRPYQQVEFWTHGHPAADADILELLLTHLPAGKQDILPKNWQKWLYRELTKDEREARKRAKEETRVSA